MPRVSTVPFQRKLLSQPHPLSPAYGRDCGPKWGTTCAIPRCNTCIQWSFSTFLMEQSSSSIYCLERNLGRHQNALRAADHTQNQFFLFLLSSDLDKHLGPEGMWDKCIVKKQKSNFTIMWFLPPLQRKLSSPFLSFFLQEQNCLCSKTHGREATCRVTAKSSVTSVSFVITITKQRFVPLRRGILGRNGLELLLPLGGLGFFSASESIKAASVRSSWWEKCLIFQSTAKALMVLNYD